MRKPKYYQTPLRSRDAIIAWIKENTADRYYDHENCPFCFNVKVYRVDFDFDHLLKIYREQQDGNKHDDWLAEARQRWEEHKDNDLWEWAVENCREAFCCGSDGTPNQDTYRTLWDGTELDVSYSFRGRSGGWLSLDRFQGWTLTDFPEALTKMSYKELRQLYQLIVMLVHDLRREAIRAEIEYQAAWALFVNVCSDLTEKEYPQRKFAFMSE